VVNGRGADGTPDVVHDIEERAAGRPVERQAFRRADPDQARPDGCDRRADQRQRHENGQEAEDRPA